MWVFSPPKFIPALWTLSPLLERQTARLDGNYRELNR
jgi:hypothetical protein